MKIEDFVELTWNYFDRFGLTSNGWTFDINNNLVRTLGICNEKNKLLVFSEKMINQFNKEQVELVILHEIAHYLVGNKYGHGPVWQAKAIELGTEPSPTMCCRIKTTKDFRLTCSR